MVSHLAVAAEFRNQQLLPNFCALDTSAWGYLLDPPSPSHPAHPPEGGSGNETTDEASSSKLFIAELHIGNVIHSHACGVSALESSSLELEVPEVALIQYANSSETHRFSSFTIYKLFLCLKPQHSMFDSLKERP